MRWFWQRRKEHEPSEAALEARAETQDAKEKLQEVHEDDDKIKKITNRTQRLAEGNNFASDIRKALGAGR